jgi:hypothetical protein
MLKAQSYKKALGSASAPAAAADLAGRSNLRSLQTVELRKAEPWPNGRFQEKNSNFDLLPSFEVSGRRALPFHIHNPKRPSIGGKTNRTREAYFGLARAPANASDADGKPSPMSSVTKAKDARGNL